MTFKLRRLQTVAVIFGFYCVVQDTRNRLAAAIALPGSTTGMQTVNDLGLWDRSPDKRSTVLAPLCSPYGLRFLDIGEMDWIHRIRTRSPSVIVVSTVLPLLLAVILESLF